MTRPQWCSETIIPSVRMSYKASRILARVKTAYQKAVVFENESFGRVLMLDDAVQTSTEDEFVYHEMLAHVPLFTHGGEADVLIIGGGDCGLAEEVLKHKAVRSVTQVEIDAKVTELAREYFADINGPVFADPRFALHHGDGAAFVRTTEQSFDVALVDSTDPIGPGRVLFEPQFYAAVRKCLKPGGVLVVQAGVPFLQKDSFSMAMRNLASTFPIVECYLLTSPTYFGGQMALGWASQSLEPDSVSLETLMERYAASGLETRYYTPQVHKAAFALPPYIGEMLAKAKEAR
ncbi:MAG TPA: polyamine aminopropyltransferase [Steroidobacter sp.]